MAVLHSPILCTVTGLYGLNFLPQLQFQDKNLSLMFALLTQNQNKTVNAFRCFPHKPKALGMNSALTPQSYFWRLRISSTRSGCRSSRISITSYSERLPSGLCQIPDTSQGITTRQPLLTRFLHAQSPPQARRLQYTHSPPSRYNSGRQLQRSHVSSQEDP